MSDMAILFASENQDWNTPSCVLERVRAFNGGRIKLDPASNAQSIVDAEVEYRLERGEDGLSLPWDLGGLVFLNPPYSDEIGPFIERANWFGRRGVETIALVPHRTDTAWYQDNIRGVRAKCEWRGRLKFMRGVADQRQLALIDVPERPAAEGEFSAPFPAVVLYWGANTKKFKQAFSSAGEIWTR